MSEYEYQLIVIGAGPGGYTAALAAAKQGLKTAVIENRDVGGTCLNRGCVPTKALLHASEVYSEAKNGARMGVHAEQASVDFSELFAFKAKTVETLRGGIEGLFKSAKVDVYRGTGSITAPHTVAVSGEKEETLTGENILIATGSVPSRPLIPGLTLPGVVTSDELLEGFSKLPETLVIIGGGVIGIELATFFLELGTKVKIVEGLDRLLPNMDRELGQSLAQLLKKQGAEIYTGAMVNKVEQTEHGLSVCFTQKEKPASAEGELVICAIGRRPYTEGLFAEGFALTMDGRRVKVDEHFKTSEEGIYAIGDVSSPVQLAHVASAQATACVSFIAGNGSEVNLSLVPGCVYCKPEIATVGLTEAQAKEAGIPAVTAKCTLFANARTLIADPGRSFLKLTAHAETGALLGAVLMCEHATDMVSELSEAIANKMTPGALLRAMRPHPTFEEALDAVLLELNEKLKK